MPESCSISASSSSETACSKPSTEKVSQLLLHRHNAAQQASEKSVITHLEVSKGKGKLLCTSLRITVYVESKCRNKCRLGSVERGK